ncbi:hypothetical protein N8Z19_00045 [Saprospiraceae bacterium]|nr:hypothetical protein [Saprospiraceae bacterium]
MEELEVNISNSKIMSLHNYGFEEAGVQRGNPEIFKNNLEYIFNGALIDESVVKPLTAEQKFSINRELEQIESNLSEKRGSIGKLNDNNCKLEQIIEELKVSKDGYERGEISKNGITEVIEVFNLTKFVITSFFLSMLSIFIFFFYVAVVYKSLFVSPQDIAEAIANGEWGVSLLPDWAEVYEALTNNLMVVFAPFIFYGFGYAVHLLLGIKSKWKYVYGFIILAVTFVLDYLLADQIHKKANEAATIMGTDTSNKFEDILLVIIMGFVVYIVWSIIFHFWMTELEKRNIPSRIGKLIRGKKQEIVQNTNEIGNLKSEIGALNAKSDQLSKNLTTQYISMTHIKSSLLHFTSGWFSFLSALNSQESKDKLEKCTLHKDRFAKKYNIDLQLKSVK